MKLTNRQVVHSISALNTLNSLKLPVKASFKLAKTSRELDATLQVYNNTLQKLQDEHCERDEDGGVKSEGNKIVLKDVAAFNKAFEELLLIDNDVKVKRLKVKDLGNISVEPAVLYQLDWLLEDDEEV
jgi:hypothetical protein